MARDRVSVRFRDFWPGFDPSQFFLPMLRGACREIDFHVVENGAVDLEFVSVFPKEDPIWRAAARRLAPRWRRYVGVPVAHASPSPEAKISIWYTGENIRPPLGDWDLRLSFEGDSVRLANRYLPLWWMLFPELLLPAVCDHADPGRLGRVMTLDEVTTPRLPERRERDRFACAFIGNPEPLRMHAVRALSAIAPVDVFGGVTNRRVATKQEIARRYRFVLCFENRVTPGYVTEKVFDAWGSGAVPIWNGLDAQGYLNDAALINYATFAGMDDFCEHVARIHADDDAWAGMASQPLLRRRPSLTAIRAIILDLLVDAGVVTPSVGN